MNSLILTMFLFVIFVGIGLLIVISITRRSGQLLSQEKYRTRWLQITQNAQNTPESLQLTIIQADKLLDMALRERGVRGATLGERLKNANSYLSNVDAVWRAHKLRNRIAHDDGVTITKQQTTDALKIFKKALTDLGAL